jgi:hypothetical protein
MTISQNNTTETNRCESCEALMINGVYCHEENCPTKWKNYSRSCKWCGSNFMPEHKYQLCCSLDCAETYYG